MRLPRGSDRDTKRDSSLVEAFALAVCGRRGRNLVSGSRRVDSKTTARRVGGGSRAIRPRKPSSADDAAPLSPPFPYCFANAGNPPDAVQFQARFVGFPRCRLATANRGTGRLSGSVACERARRPKACRGVFRTVRRACRRGIRPLCSPPDNVQTCTRHWCRYTNRVCLWLKSESAPAKGLKMFGMSGMVAGIERHCR